MKIDCKTRWNSLFDMLIRFYELKKCIQISTLQIDRKDHILTEKDFDNIKKFCDSLLPLKVALNSLCKKDSDILTCDKVIFI